MGTQPMAPSDQRNDRLRINATDRCTNYCCVDGLQRREHDSAKQSLRDYECSTHITRDR